MYAGQMEYFRLRGQARTRSWRNHLRPDSVLGYDTESHWDNVGKRTQNGKLKLIGQNSAGSLHCSWPRSKFQPGCLSELKKEL